MFGHICRFIRINNIDSIANSNVSDLMTAGDIVPFQSKILILGASFVLSIGQSVLNSTGVFANNGINNNGDGAAHSFKSNFTTSNSRANSSTNFAKNATQTVMPGVQGLPESKALLQHDEVAPGLNRQQAMELESQYGHLPAYAEQELKDKGLLKSDVKAAPVNPLKSATTHRVKPISKPISKHGPQIKNWSHQQR